MCGLDLVFACPFGRGTPQSRPGLGRGGASEGVIEETEGRGQTERGMEGGGQGGLPHWWRDQEAPRTRERKIYAACARAFGVSHVFGLVLVFALLVQRLQFFA